jgi:hypothetical protein
VILTCFPSIPDSRGDLFTGRRWRNPTGKRLVRVAGADIKECVSAFAGESLRDDSLNGRVLASVTGGEISSNGRRGLSLGYVEEDRVTNNQERNATRN